MPDEEVTIEDTMGEVFDKANEAVETSDAAESQDAATEEASEQARGEDGKFIKTEETEDTAEAAEEAPAEESTETTEEQTDEAEETHSPPDRWSSEDKEAFGTLPREAQELVLKREREVEGYLTEKSQKIADQKRGYEQLEGIIGPRRQQFTMNGTTVEQGLAQLFALSDYAERDPAGFVQWFAQQRGIDLQGQAGEDEFIDPDIAALTQQVNDLKSHIQGDANQRQQADLTATEAKIETFRKDAEHFDAVEQDIQAILPAVQASNPGAGIEAWLKQAYESAVWANPKTREAMLSSQREVQAKERTETQRADAAKAKKAAGTNLSPKGSSSGGERKASSIEETMGEVYDRVNAA